MFNKLISNVTNNMSKEELKQINDQYQEIDDTHPLKDRNFLPNIKAESARLKTNLPASENISMLIDQLASEFASHMTVYTYDENTLNVVNETFDLEETKVLPISLLNQLPKAIRPQAQLGALMSTTPKHMSMKAINMYAKKHNELLAKAEQATGDQKEKHLQEALQMKFHMQKGIELSDVWPEIHAYNQKNPNTFSFWFPKLASAAAKQSFFKIPRTQYCSMPAGLVQLGRLDDYQKINEVTLSIVDKAVKDAFQLDENKDYFIKTGTYASKFDYRNARINEPSEVNEIGRYWVYLLNQAYDLMFRPIFSGGKQYAGLALTNDLVIREFIQNENNDPTIYHGMPLRTEYRVFIDCDSDELVGTVPYWHPIVMKEHFKDAAFKTDNVHYKHDYLMYSGHEDVMMQRYNDNIQDVNKHVKNMIKDIDLEGKWLLDVMQEGNDFYLIDMARMEDSALTEFL